MQLNPLSTDVYICINRWRTKLKLLQWEGDGFSLYNKRLERGTYERAVRASNETFVCISDSELQNIFKGISARSNRPKNAIAKAIGYCLGRWNELKCYTTDGKLNIDNNPVENSIRPVAVGRKNYLFAGSHQAAQRSAMYILY